MARPPARRRAAPARPRVLALVSAKGGVGKTTAAVTLAHLAASQGCRTLLWDLDAQGAAGHLLRVRPRRRVPGRLLLGGRRGVVAAARHSDVPGLDVVAADDGYRHADLVLSAAKQPARRLATLLEPLAGHYDLVVLDCPPGTSLLAGAVARCADVLLAPVIPTPLSVRSLDGLAAVVAESGRRRTRLLVHVSMLDGRRRLHRDTVALLRGTRADVAAAEIPALSVIEQTAERRSPVTVFAPRSLAAARFRALWDEVATALGVEVPRRDAAGPERPGDRAR